MTLTTLTTKSHGILDIFNDKCHVFYTLHSITSFTNWHSYNFVNDINDINNDIINEK